MEIRNGKPDAASEIQASVMVTPEEIWHLRDSAYGALGDLPRS
jgi:hypothetical protein